MHGDAWPHRYTMKYELLTLCYDLYFNEFCNIVLTVVLLMHFESYLLYVTYLCHFDH